MRIQKIWVTAFAVALTAVLAALPTTALADDTLALPDSNFRNALIAAGVDSNSDGMLTAAELVQYTGSLDLHGKNITNLSGLGYMVNLQSLNLNDNLITSIPAEIGNCRELTALDLGSNQINALPTEITGLSKLTTLKLGGTALGALPTQFYKLTALQSLDISSTSFTSLPTQLQSLPALTTLSAANLGLSSLPVWLGQCSGLQSLNLDGNSLSALPDLSALSNLKVLTLNANDFSSLPVQVCALPSLQQLELCYNRLTTLGAQINLPASLTALRLTGNRLEQLPSELGSLTGLKTLELGSNSLIALPATLGNLTQLRTLDISGNKLSDLPIDIFKNMSLQSLNLNFNYLNPTAGSDLVEINKATGQKQYTEQTTFTGYYTDDSQISHTKECYQGESITVAPVGAPEGQSFVGWDFNTDSIADTGADGSGIFVAIDYQKVTVTFAPVFAKADQFAITFLAGDHGRVNGSTSVRLLTNGQTLGHTPDIQADAEYRFVGWEPAGDGPSLTHDQVLQQNYTSDAQYTARYTGNSANLSGLSADQGTWSPGFYSFSYSYVLLVPGTAPDTGTVTLTATLQSADATVSPASITSGLTVNVAKRQSQTVTITVTAPDTVTQKTYTVKVVHADESGAALSDLELSSNSLSAGTVEPFSPTTLEYHVNLSPDDDTLHIQTTSASGAVVAFQTREGGSFVPSASGGIDFDVSAGVDFQVNLRVTSPDGYSKRLYQLIIRREWSKDCTLRSLTGSPELIKVSESADTVAYTMQLPENTPKGIIEFQMNYRFAKAIVINATAADSVVAVPLQNGESRTVSIQVIAQDPNITKSYVITVTRAISTDCTLGTLTGTPALTKVSESAGKNVYSMALPELTASGTIRFQTTSPFAKAIVTNGTAVNGAVTVALENGATRTLSIQVVAQDTSKVKTYEITVTRAKSTNCTLSSLTGTPALVKVSESASKSVYTMAMPELTASGTIQYKVSSPLAKATVANGTAVNGVVTVALENGATRTLSIQVMAQDTSKVKTYEITVTRAKSSLATPAIKAIPSSYSSITLTWGTVLNASGYEIYRASSSSGIYTKVATIASGSTASYTNTSLTTGTAYYYKVRAYRTVSATTIYSGYSSILSAIPSLSMPTVKAASASYNGITLTWGTVSGASGYEISRASSSSGLYTKVATIASGSTVTYTNASLVTGTVYYYKVRAFRTVVTTPIYSGYSAIVSAKPIPATPAGVKSASASYNSTKLTWGAVSGASGYEITRATSSSGVYTKVATITSGSTVTYTNASLVTGTVYYYKVRAYRTVVTTPIYSGYSAVVSAKPTPATPAGVKAASVSYNSVKLTWGAVSGASGYEITRATSSSGIYSKVATIASGSTITYTNANLATGTVYYYKVRAYRTVATAAIYSECSAVISAKPVPAVPASVKAARASATSVKVSWNTVAGASGYEVYRATSSTGAYTLAKSTTAYNWSNTGLITGKSYYYKVRAWRLVGGSRVYGTYCVIVYAKP